MAADIVMFVDDQLEPMRLYILQLQEAGFEVVACSGPDEALAKAGELGARIDAIVLDIMMPPGKTYGDEESERGMRTGVLLCRQLREQLPLVPILVLTNAVDPAVVGAFDEGTFLRVLRKLRSGPVNLTEQVRNLIALPAWILDFELLLTELARDSEELATQTVEHCRATMRQIATRSMTLPAAESGKKGAIVVHWRPDKDVELLFEARGDMEVRQAAKPDESLRAGPKEAAKVGQRLAEMFAP